MAQYVMIAAAVAQVGSTLATAEQQATSMRLQAAQSELQGRQNALNYNKQAVAILDRQSQLQGMIRARAAAGGVNPDTGSALSLQEANALKAGREIEMAKENAQTSIYGGLSQSQSLQSAAEFTEGMAELNAFAQAGTSYARYQSVQTPSGKTQ